MITDRVCPTQLQLGRTEQSTRSGKLAPRGYFASVGCRMSGVGCRVARYVSDGKNRLEREERREERKRPLHDEASPGHTRRGEMRRTGHAPHDRNGSVHSWLLRKVLTARKPVEREAALRTAGKTEESGKRSARTVQRRAGEAVDVRSDHHKWSVRSFLAPRQRKPHRTAILCMCLRRLLVCIEFLYYNPGEFFISLNCKAF